MTPNGFEGTLTDHEGNTYDNVRDFRASLLHELADTLNDLLINEDWPNRKRALLVLRDYDRHFPGQALLNGEFDHL